MPHAAPSLSSALVYQHMGPAELAALEQLFDVSALPPTLRGLEGSQSAPSSM